MNGFHQLDDVKNIDVPEGRVAEIIQTSSADHSAKTAHGFVKNRCAAYAVQAAEVWARIGCESLPKERVQRSYTHIMELQVAISTRDAFGFAVDESFRAKEAINLQYVGGIARPYRIGTNHIRGAVEELRADFVRKADDSNVFKLALLV